MDGVTDEAFERTVDVAGFRCALLRTGRRKPDALPVFFISGAFQTIRSWDKFAAHFEDKTQVLRADLPGTGSADVLPHGYGLDFLADAACALLDAGEIEQAYVISASYGSPVAYRLAQRHPQRVRRMVLAGVMRAIPSEFRAPTEASLVSIAEGRMRDFAEQVVDKMLCQDSCKAVDKRALAVRVLMGQLQRMSEADRVRYRENTRRLLDHSPLDVDHPPNVPALVFTGEHDVFTRPEYCREIAEAIPNALFTTIERTDHLFHIERFETTLSLLDAFHDSERPGPIDGCRPIEVCSRAVMGTSSRLTAAISAARAG